MGVYMAWRNWGDHPIVVTVSVIAGLAGIAALGHTVYSERQFGVESPPSSSLQSTGQVSKIGVAIVFDPPSNVRELPNGNFLCSVRERTTINIYSSVGDWYYTDICGTMGVIHFSQVTFQPN